MPRTFKQFLEKLAGEKAPGPTPSFSVFHLLLALELIANKSVGRSKLAQELGVGEGVGRTVIGRLREAHLIATSKIGCQPTEKGLMLFNNYQSTVRKAAIAKNELTFTDYNFAILVRNRGHKVKSGIEQRDAAVMAGAKGATTMLFRKGCLIFPSFDRDVAKDSRKASNDTVALLKPEENDVVIIASAENMRKAEYAALAAAWTLLNDD
jgi:hypothetical protein